MVLSPDNESADKYAELDESLEGLVDLLLDLEVVTQVEQTPPSKDLLTKPSIKQPKSETIAGYSLVRENIRENAAELSKNSEKDLKYAWYYYQRLEEKIKQIEIRLQNPPIANRESLMRAILPLLDEAIRQRGVQEEMKMGWAIAPLLPTAIARQIEHSPTSIGKAIAPELGIAIQEQIKLDPAIIATSLAPQMGNAIKTQIVLEKEAMVDALYPVIGNTISKYMAEMVKSINAKVESALSFSALLRKVKAKFLGVSEAELILQESLGYEIQAILLIHKASGLVIREIQPPFDYQIDTNLLAGALTAIRSFVSECIAKPDTNSELHQIEYSTSKILLEVAGYCYLAAIVKGEPSKDFIAKMRKTLTQIVLDAGKSIADYDGDPTSISPVVDSHFQSLIDNCSLPKPQNKFPTALVLLLGAIAIPLAFIWYRSHLAHQIETKVAQTLDAVPELSIYRITPQVNGNTLMLTGRLPHAYLRQKAEQITRQVAPNWSVANQILAVDVPADPMRTSGEIERVAWIYNRKKGVSISTKHDFGSHSLQVSGFVPTISEIKQLSQAFQQIPGINNVINTVQIHPLIETRIYFDLNSPEITDPDNATKLSSIRQFLDRHPGVHLKIIAHTDGIGEKNRNLQLSRERARRVQQALIAEGINPIRLQIQTVSASPPPGITAQEPLWLSRSVRFEVFIPYTQAH